MGCSAGWFNDGVSNPRLCSHKEGDSYSNPVDNVDALGHELLLNHLDAFGIMLDHSTLNPRGECKNVDINLRDANDLLPPLAAALALCGGGRLRGAAHAKHKESNRIQSTKTLLESFGISSTIEEDGLSIEGGQRLSKPEKLIDTFGDHRIQMTAILLASQVGGVIEGRDCIELPILNS